MNTKRFKKSVGTADKIILSLGLLWLVAILLLSCPAPSFYIRANIPDAHSEKVIYKNCLLTKLETHSSITIWNANNCYYVSTANQMSQRKTINQIGETNHE